MGVGAGRLTVHSGAVDLTIRQRRRGAGAVGAAGGADGKRCWSGRTTGGENAGVLGKDRVLVAVFPKFIDEFEGLLAVHFAVEAVRHEVATVNEVLVAARVDTQARPSEGGVDDGGLGETMEGSDTPLAPELGNIRVRVHEVLDYDIGAHRKKGT